MHLPADASGHVRVDPVAVIAIQALAWRDLLSMPGPNSSYHGVTHARSS